MDLDAVQNEVIDSVSVLLSETADLITLWKSLPLDPRNHEDCKAKIKQTVMKIVSFDCDRKENTINQFC